MHTIGRVPRLRRSVRIQFANPVLPGLGYLLPSGPRGLTVSNGIDSRSPELSRNSRQFNQKGRLLVAPWSPNYAGSSGKIRQQDLARLRDEFAEVYEQQDFREVQPFVGISLSHKSAVRNDKGKEASWLVGFLESCSPLELSPQLWGPEIFADVGEALLQLQNCIFNISRIGQSNIAPHRIGTGSDTCHFA